MRTSHRKILATICVTMVTMSSITITQIIPDSGDDIFNKVIPSEGYEGYNASKRGTKGPGEPLGFQPDLIVTSIDRSMLFTDNQALTISGTISADIKNQGDVDTGANFDIAFFEDSNNNGDHEPSDNLLGSNTYLGILSAGASTTVSASVSGSVLFRDNLIYTYVDSYNVIAEDNETNNLRNTGQECEYRPPTAAFSPILEWAWTGSSIYPGWNQVMCAPAVADLNQDGIPDIVFNTFTGPGLYEWDGILRAISGDGSVELFSITDNNYRCAGCFNVAIADIDNDDLPEIINLRHRYNGDEYRLMAFENDGTHKWFSNVAIQVRPTAGATVADIDEDNIPEIIVGEYVFNNDGTLRWEGTGSDGLDISTVANLDMVGNPEIVAGNTAYQSDGAIYWQNGNVTEGRPAVGNFDSDDHPEVVVVGNGYIYMLEHDGALKWGPYDIPPPGIDHDFGGPPTIGDFDGDGEAEIGVAGGYKYVVYEGNGTVKWSNETQDYSSSRTGSSVFDFEGDGSVEVIYADEYYLRIYNGSNGNVLWEYWLGSGTLLELPVIADVDNDNNAEIVMICNDYHPWGSHTGVYVFGDSNDNWVNTRKIWNQHAYHITNVKDNATIPQYEQNNWEIYNNFRCQALVTNLFAAPDLSACYIRVDDASFPISIDLTARIGNGGAIDVIAGVSIAFYDGDPSTGGILIGTIPTGVTLAPGEYEDVTITWLSPVGGYHDFYVVADDDGTGNGGVSECCELNNIWHYSMIIGQIPPVADVGENQVVYEGDVVQLNGSASYDHDGNMTNYEWDFDANDGLWWNTGGTPEAIDPITTHTYGDNGDFKVTLRVTDDQNLTDTGTCNITVLNVAPIIDPIQEYTINEYESVTLIGHATDPGSDDLTFTWNWGYVSWSDKTTTYYNDGLNPDPYPSPTINPRNITEETTCQYGDNGVFTVTLTVTDDDGGSTIVSTNITVKNVLPIVTIESATMNVEISLRVAGSKWSNVGLTLYENDTEIGYLEVERWPGSPDDNPTCENPALPTTLDLAKSYKAIVTYDPYPDNNDEIKGDQPNNGKDKKNNAGNPVWIIMKFSDGSEEKIHHTFNTQQSKKKDSEHWNHVEPWEVDLKGYLVGHKFEVSSHITDPGSDDEALSYTYGSQVVTFTYLNNPPDPDPYPSPELNPVDLYDKTELIYQGTGIIILTVEDDDGAIYVTTFKLTVG